MAASADWFTSARSTVLIVDIVESVRLIQADEVNAVGRWLSIVNHVENILLKKHGGRLVKSLGDGMLLEMTSVRTALRLAFDTLAFADDLNAPLQPDSRIHLRLGLQVGDVMVDRHDVYGHEVNLAARLAGLADAGEVVGSAEVRDLVTSGVDADVEDMGECILKHVTKPVRAYKFAPPGTVRPRIAPPASQQLLPSLAVIPFRTLGGSGRAATGQIMAEELIRAFGQSAYVNVISRLSTAPFAQGDHTLDQIAESLGANHVLTGTVIENGEDLILSLDLTEVRSRQVIWSERFQDKMGNVLTGDQTLVASVSEAVGRAIINREMQRARSLPVRTLESYTLLLAAVNAMYRLSRSDFDLSHKMLEAVIDRNPRHSVPLAWMGNWHVLRVQQGWTEDADNDTRVAEVHTARALDLNPDCEQALTIDGLVSTNLTKNFDQAMDRYQEAIRFNPNNALANLLLGTCYAFSDDGPSAVKYCERALRLSPLDPQQYFFDCLAAAAYIYNDQADHALMLARRSIRANSTHTSTLRTLAIAEWLVGERDAARDTVRKLTVLEPNLTVGQWLARNPAGRFEKGRQLASILQEAGLPK